jgi:DNA-directed RNA polymerase sigma subunit (sigma70/sigma32)
VSADSENWADRYIQQANDAPHLTPSEVSRLAGLAQEGDPLALTEVVDAHRRLVVSTTSKYTGRLELSKAFRLGDVGLTRAVNKFDHTKDVQFSTYAAWWIRQAITRGLNESTPPDAT